MENSKISQYFIGDDIFNELKNDITNFQNIVVIHGEKSLKSLNYRLNDALEGKNINYILYGTECSFSQIGTLLEKIELWQVKKFFKTELIIAIGGGKAIDTGKIVGDKLEIPVLTIPTIASTCAATSSLSVVYKDTHEYETLHFLKKSPYKAYLDLKILLAAPKKYLWAGIGDTLAKYYEMVFKQTGEKIENFSTSLGTNICYMCKDSILRNGESSLKTEIISNEFKDIVGTIIISTGMVSNLIDFKYNGALAHGIFNALTTIKSIEEEHLHGEVVAFGILVQLLIENKENDYGELIKFYEKINLPISIWQLVDKEDFYRNKDTIIDKIINDKNATSARFNLNREDLIKFIEK